MPCKKSEISEHRATTETTCRVLTLDATTTVTMTMVIYSSPLMKLKIMTKTLRARRKGDSLSACTVQKGMCCIAS